MLRRVQFPERLLKGSRVGGNRRIFDAIASGGQPCIGDLNPLLNGRKLPGFEIGEFLLSGVT